MTYAKVNVERTEILEICPRPAWFVDGEPVTEDVLAAGGFECDETGEPIRTPDGSYKLATDQPGFVPVVRQPVEGLDDLLNYLTWNDQAQWIIESDRVIQTYTLTAYPVVHVKTQALTRIDAQADGARYTFVTPGGPGQALEYNETHRELLQWNDAADPVITDFPMLAAEYNARLAADPEVTVQQVIADSFAEVDLWLQGGAAIKEIRRTGKCLVEVAQTPEQVKQIYEWVIASLESATTLGTFTPYAAEG